LEAAFGLRSRDGVLLVTPSGEVVNVSIFENLDQNHDGRLSKEEYFKQHPDPKYVETLRKLDDADDDGIVTFKEWAANPARRVDVISYFRQMDTDADGAISPEESLKKTHWHWMAPSPEVIVPVFDSDGNGVLSLEEFRLTWEVNRVQNWAATRTDVD